MKTIRCPRPAHDDKMPSCAVYDDGTSEIHWHCFGCGWHADGVGYLTDIEGMDMQDAIAEANKRGWRVPKDGERSSSEVVRRAETRGQRAPTMNYAIRLWRESQPAAGTPLDSYFAARSIPRVPPAVRYHPGVVKRELGAELPAAVCAVTRTDTIVGVSVWWLVRDEGMWRKERTGVKARSYGNIIGGSVKIGRPRQGIVIVAEGVETAASAAIIHGHAAEAVCGKSNIRRWLPPAGVKHVMLAPDNDASIGANDTTPECAAEFVSRSRELDDMDYVTALRMPSHGCRDFSDMLMRGTVAGLPRDLPKPLPQRPEAPVFEHGAGHGCKNAAIS